MNEKIVYEPKFAVKFSPLLWSGEMPKAEG
jgi:hypothetical protein